MLEYLQKKKKDIYKLRFKYTENGYKWEVHAHTGVGNGQFWVIKREIISNAIIIKYQEFLNRNNCIRGHIWYDAITNQKAGTITDTEKLIFKERTF